jgi:hypothetical protein
MGLKTENTRKDKDYSLHVYLITVEVGIVRRRYGKIQAKSLSSLVSKMYTNTHGIILLEYGISLARWLIILILCNDGCRLKSTKLRSRNHQRRRCFRVTTLLTPHPLNAAPQPSYIEEMCPLVYCIANQYAHPYRARHILLLDRTEVRSVPVPANMRYCMG